MRNLENTFAIFTCLGFLFICVYANKNSKTKRRDTLKKCFANVDDLGEISCPDRDAATKTQGES